MLCRLIFDVFSCGDTSRHRYCQHGNGEEGEVREVLESIKHSEDENGDGGGEEGKCICGTKAMLSAQILRMLLRGTIFAPLPPCFHLGQVPSSKTLLHIFLRL